MHAGGADDRDQEETDGADSEAGVLDGVRHGENASPDVAFEKVEHGVPVPEKNIAGSIRPR